MYEIKIFENEAFRQLRTTTINDEPWFADVCRVLGLGNPTNAVKRLEKDERMVISSIEGHSGKRGGAHMMNVVNESGLFSLILGSRKPEAKQFKRWITHEILPSIRKTGGYIANQEELSEDEILARAHEIASKILDNRERRLKEAEKIEEL